MVWKIKNNKTGKEYLFNYVKCRINGYTNYTEFEIPGGTADQTESLPLGGSGVIFNVDWAMKDDNVDVSNGTQAGGIKTPDEQELYWIESIAAITVDTDFTFTKGENTYTVSLMDWDINVDPTDPEKNDCNVKLKLGNNSFA